jgi:hypothetical protein
MCSSDSLCKKKRKRLKHLQYLLPSQKDASQVSKEEVRKFPPKLQKHFSRKTKQDKHKTTGFAKSHSPSLPFLFDGVALHIPLYYSFYLRNSP